MIMSYYFRVLRKALPAAVACAITLTLASTHKAQAITNGQPDGNGHPSVGLMVLHEPGEGLFRLCSGFLIAPNQFLTAAHCLAFLPGSGLILDGVTFDPVFDPNAVNIVPAALFTVDPQFTGRDNGDRHDMGVITLSANAATAPVRLPTAGLLDQLAAQGGLRGQQFTVVGYGVTGMTNGGGPPQPIDFDQAVRRVAISPFMSLSQNMLKLLGENNATGEGGVCFADSGSPKLLNINGRDVAVAISTLGDRVCEAMSSNYRLDTPSARGFLGQFVTLP
jgi:Trypsin